MKRLAGRTDLEDALQRLDVLTKEENLMTAARILEVVTTTQELTRDIHGNFEVTKHGAQHPFSIFIYVATNLCL